MVVLSKPAILVKLPLIEACAKPPALFTEIPVIDLQHPWAKNLIVKSCEEFGFFKLVNHGVPLEFMTRLEDETVRFFNLPQHQKDRAGPPDPFGYGSKRIGLNGDVGWVEYLLLNTNAGVTSLKTTSILEANPERFRTALRDYITAVKRMAAEVLELVAEGLGLEPRNLLSRLVKDEQSDSCFRLNHYPPCPEAQLSRGGGGRKFLGFGEHTDPQIISVLRSNNTSGLQICLNDGSWVSVPPDHTSFFINVGDALQVMTNGRFKSVKHRVVAESEESRVSMIYFGGPPLGEKIKPLLVGEAQESLYKEFTWFEYKKSMYRSKLADYRLGNFERKTAATSQ